MYGCESWAIKKAECWRTDAFKLWCWRRLMRRPLDCNVIKQVNPKGNQPWIFTGRTDAEAPIFGHLMWSDSLEKTLMLGKIEGKRSLWQRVRWLASNTDSKDMNLSKLWAMGKDREAWYAAVHGVTKTETQLSNWTTTKTHPLALLLNCGAVEDSWESLGQKGDQTSQS